MGSLTRSFAAPLRVAVLGLAAIVLATLSCAPDSTGPGGTRAMSQGIAFTPVFPGIAAQVGGDASTLVPFTQVRVIIRRADNTVALDTLIAYPSDADSLVVNLQVPVSASAPLSGEVMQMNLEYMNAAGEVVFRGGPVSVVALPPGGGTPPPPVVVPVTYVGPGSNAASVAISQSSIDVVAGAAFEFSAAAFDANGSPLPATPILWFALDPGIASIAAPGAGSGTAGNSRGAGRVVAQLLTGQADTSVVNVRLPASSIAIVSGSGQSANIGQPLGQPLIVRASASDGIPVAGVSVTFAVGAGGGVVTNAVVVTDANGLAQTAWTLGAAVGQQSVTATASGLSGSPATFTATATPPPPTQLAFTLQPAGSIAGSAFTVAVTARAADGSVATTFTGPVTVGLSNNPTATPLLGTTTVNAVAGVATFTTLSITAAAPNYSLSASSPNLAGTTSVAFAVTAGPAATIVPDSGGLQSAPAGSALPQALVARVFDQFTNPVPGVTVGWAVTLGGGAVSASSGVTDAAGRARTTLTLGPVAGANIVSATTPGVTLPAVFTATGVVAGPTQLVFVTQPVNVVAGIANAPAPVVQAQDAFGNVVPTFVGNITISIGTNPGGATLIGTLTVPAVAGVAAFPNLRLNKTGAGYTLVASAVALANATSGGFSVLPAPAIAIAADSGNAQTAQATTLLPQQLVAKATDSLGNGVPGVNVAWGVTGGAGALSGTTIVTDAAGRVRTGWTLGIPLGIQSVAATSAGLAGSPVAFTATALSTAASRTWIGSTDAQWTTAANWAPAIVPGPADSVLINLGTFQPTIVAPVTVASLTLSAGATLTVNSALTVNGNLHAGTTINGTGSVVLAGAGKTLQGVIGPSIPVLVTGTYSIGPAFATVGSIDVQGSLNIAGNLLTVAGAFLTSGTGTLQMTIVGSTVAVNGNAVFAGGSTFGQLTQGILQIGGNFSQTSGTSTFSFVSSNVHTTTFSGAGAQTVSFASPDTVTLAVACAASCFRNLTINKTAGTLAFTTAASARGNLTMVAGATSVTAIGAAGSPKVITVGGNTITPGATPVQFTRFRTTGNVTLGAATVIDSIGFSGTGGQSVNAGTYGHVTFLGSPTITGDITATGDVLVANGAASTGILAPNGNTVTIGGSLTTSNGGTIQLPNATDSILVAGNATFSGGATVLTNGVLRVAGNFVQTGAATFNGVTNHKTVLTGAGGQTITLADPVNARFQRLFIEKAGGSVTLLSDVRVNGALRTSATLTSAAPLRLYADSLWGAVGSSFTPFVFELNRQLADSGAFSPDTVVFNDGINHTIQTNFAGLGTYTYKSVRVNKTGTTASFPGIAVTLLNDLVVSGGTLIVNGSAVTVSGHFKTQGGGTFLMVNGADSLGVGLDVLLQGATTAGNLTAGVITIAGSFAQAGVATSFAPSGAHRTRFGGGGAGGPVISFADPVNSRFNRLVLDKSPGAAQVISMLSDVLVIDSLTIRNATELRSNVHEKITVNGRMNYVSATSSPIVRPFLLEVTSFAPAIDSVFVGAPRFLPDTLIFSGTANYTLPFSNKTALKSVRVSTTGIVDMFGGNPGDSLSGDMHVTSGKFRLQGSSLIVQKLRTTNTGLLEMSAGVPLLTVRDTAFFGGADELGQLVAGTLRLEGHFVQNNATSATSFHADPPHITLFAGTGLQTILFATPGQTPAFSHFGNLTFANPTGVTLLSNVVTHILLDTTPGTQESVLGNGFLLTVEGSNVNNLLFNNTRVAFFDNHTITAFANVTFTNYPTNPIILSVSRTVSTGVPVFTGLTFPTVGFTGLYVSVDDPNGATGGLLNFTLTGATPGSPGIQCLRVGGAGLTWNGVGIVTC